ncbi:MAG: hydroxymethylbilane synthase [Synergistaceae bacterium]|nr:hydroxymethylbilane synthase [Synergistaceae bacterium]
MSKKIIRFGSRRSLLALAQTKIVMEATARAHPELSVELVAMETSGDRNMKPFSEASDKFGIKGLFTQELEEALLSGEIDVAVHSLKDMPVNVNPALPVVACSKREDPRDVLVLPEGKRSVSSGVVGCSSARRRVQLAALCPGLSVAPLRGNVCTRLRKLDEGEFSALVLAAAGLKRLGLEGRIARYFDTGEIIPAPGQGVLACQGRADEDYYYLDAVRDKEAEICAAAERVFSAELGGGCTAPVGAFASLDGGEITIAGLYADESGRDIRRGRARGPIEEGVAVAVRLAQELSRGEDL